MTRIVRYGVSAGLLVLLGGLFLNWIMGDDFGSWVSSARTSLRDQLASLVDEYTLELEKAREAVDQAKQRAAQLRLQKHKAAAGIATLDREITVAQQEVVDAKTQLARLHDRLRDGQTVRLVSGRVASSEQLRTFADDFTNRIQIAQEKVGYLERIMERKKVRYTSLVQLDERSPHAIQRLENSVDYLARKLEMYRDVREWADDDVNAQSEMQGLFAKAQQTLEEAHARLDAKIAEVDAILEMSLDLEIEPAPAGETESLVADIRSTLDGVGSTFAP
jgi:chromosome segregation ATPase